MNEKVGLIILDGWGIGQADHSDAIHKAKTPFFDSLIHNYPNSTLKTYGENVGLPKGQMGNSEVGHLNIGAGRVVYQDLVKINIAPKSKSETYWVCNMWMFANMKDGVPRYHKVSFKKSGKGFNYNIEGTATFTADKITPFPMEKE